MVGSHWPPVMQDCTFRRLVNRWEYHGAKLKCMLDPGSVVRFLRQFWDGFQNSR
jgi:hypothetical protein